MVTAKKRASNNRWDAANMTVLGVKVKKDYADRVRACCEARGDTVNAVLRAALDQYLEQPEGTQDPKI